MRDELRPGERLQGQSRMECVVGPMFNEGGQGWLHRVHLDGSPYVLKWYKPAMLRAEPGLKPRLRRLIALGAPSSKFVWPFDLVERRDAPGQFGYLMPALDDGLVSAAQLIAGTASTSFRVLALASFRLAEAFSEIHGNGLAYRDISPGNVFVDPHTGAVRVCDNDNVDVDGAPSAIGGTPAFQPPELVMRAQGAWASRKTDLYALAVLLFRLLHIGHPLVGRREQVLRATHTQEQVRSILFGREPRFVFDPRDDSNRPAPEDEAVVGAYWALYPQALRDLFVRAFTTGLFDAEHGRVLESEWRSAMSQLHDAVLGCPRCGAENFYDPTRLASGAATFRCWDPHCSSPLPVRPPRIGIRRAGSGASEAPASVVVLSPGARLFGHHLAGGAFDFERTGAEVVADAQGDRIELANRSTSAWRVLASPGADAPAEVAPGARIAISSGLRLRFERTEGEVKL